MTTRSAKLAFGASVMALAAQMNGACAADPAVAPVNGESTAVLIGRETATTAPGRASFTINLGELGFVGKIGLLSSEKTAIIFTGKPDEPGRVCPFFNLATRKYEIEEVKSDVFKITADITDSAMARIQASGCMVTTRPDLKKIKYLHPAPNHDSP